MNSIYTDQINFYKDQINFIRDQISSAAETASKQITDKCFKDKKTLIVPCEYNKKKFNITITFLKEVDLKKNLKGIEEAFKEQAEKAFYLATLYKLGEKEETNTKALKFSQKDDHIELTRIVKDIKTKDTSKKRTGKDELGRNYYSIENFNDHLHDKKLGNRKEKLDKAKGQKNEEVKEKAYIAILAASEIFKSNKKSLIPTGSTTISAVSSSASSAKDKSEIVTFEDFNKKIKKSDLSYIEQLYPDKNEANKAITSFMKNLNEYEIAAELTKGKVQKMKELAEKGCPFAIIFQSFPIPSPGLFPLMDSYIPPNPEWEKNLYERGFKIKEFPQQLIVMETAALGGSVDAIKWLAKNGNGDPNDKQFKIRHYEILFKPPILNKFKEMRNFITEACIVAREFLQLLNPEKVDELTTLIKYGPTLNKDNFINKLIRIFESKK